MPHFFSWFSWSFTDVFMFSQVWLHRTWSLRGGVNRRKYRYLEERCPFHVGWVNRGSTGKYFLCWCPFVIRSTQQGWQLSFGSHLEQVSHKYSRKSSCFQSQTNERHPSVSFEICHELDSIHVIMTPVIKNTDFMNTEILFKGLTRLPSFNNLNSVQQRVLWHHLCALLVFLFFSTSMTVRFWWCNNGILTFLWFTFRSSVGNSPKSHFCAVCASVQILVGSSIGGWLMLLAAIARPEKTAALVGIATAADHFVTSFNALPLEVGRRNMIAFINSATNVAHVSSCQWDLFIFECADPQGARGQRGMDSAHQTLRGGILQD